MICHFTGLSRNEEIGLCPSTMLGRDKERKTVPFYSTKLGRDKGDTGSFSPK